VFATMLPKTLASLDCRRNALNLARPGPKKSPGTRDDRRSSSECAGIAVLWDKSFEDENPNPVTVVAQCGALRASMDFRHREQ
jgi:hypothetical protein